MILLKTTIGAVCGGFTSKDWDGSGRFTNDPDAFVFNMTCKYEPNKIMPPVARAADGFSFGNNILLLTSATTLNEKNMGVCKMGKQRGYDIEGEVSSLTNQKDNFTCAELEVYKVVY